MIALQFMQDVRTSRLTIYKSMSILVHLGSTCRPWMIWRMDDGGDDDDDDDDDDDHG